MPKEHSASHRTVASPEKSEGTHGASEFKIDQIRVTAYEVPTDGPEGKESDGTLEWESTTLVLVQVRSGKTEGLGYTYGDVATAKLIDSKLKPLLEGKNALLVHQLWHEQRTTLRNAGQTGLGAMALAAVDIALWDLKARSLNLPLYQLLGGFHCNLPIYASGGFCNYPLERLTSQVSQWADAGITQVKIKTSREPAQDPARLAACRAQLGDSVTLMTDANGALQRKEALYWARRLREEWAVSWFEEPVSSDDREGLRLLRDSGPPGLDIAAGEYGYVLRDFLDLVEAGAVDCLQADVTRCEGITGLLRVGALSAAHCVDLSAHCAPAVSAHAFSAVERLRHLEYFHDHVRVESLLFDGTLLPTDGQLRPDAARHGLGLELKQQDAQRYLIYG